MKKKILLILVFCLMIGSLCQAQYVGRATPAPPWEFKPKLHWYLFDIQIGPRGLGLGTGGLKLSFFEKEDWYWGEATRLLGIGIAPRVLFLNSWDEIREVKLDYYISFLLVDMKDLVYREKYWVGFEIGYSPRMKEIMFVIQFSL